MDSFLYCMRICIDATNVQNFPTGAGVYTTRILEELLPLHSNDDIILLVSNTLEDHHPLLLIYTHHANVVITRTSIPVLGIQRDIRLAWFLFWHRKRFDIFFSFMPYLSVLYWHPRSIVTVHDVWYLSYPELFHSVFHRWYFTYMFKASLRHAYSIITVSHATQATLAMYVSPQKPVVVASPASNIGLPKEYDKKQTDRMVDPPYILFVGEKRVHKNIIALIQAFALFKKKCHTNVVLVLVGKEYGTYMKTIEKEIIINNLTHDVVFFGSVSQEKLVNLYTHALCVALLSLYEGFGIPILEAMTCGVPVISSTAAALKEVGGDAPLYAEPNDIETIAKHMMVYATNLNIRNEHIEKGKKQAVLFSWQQSAGIVSPLFQK